MECKQLNLSMVNMMKLPPIHDPNWLPLQIVNTVASPVMEFIKSSADIPSPEYKTSESAGLDLINASGEQIVLVHGEVRIIPTGLFVKLPPNTMAMVTPRSGKSISGFSVNNSPGIIDSDYRQEIKVIAIHNGGGDWCVIEPGERIAQLVVMPYIKVIPLSVEEFSTDNFTNTRTGGLGSSGKF
jgi:dUTP pyrophosphatase